MIRGKRRNQTTCKAAGVTVLVTRCSPQSHDARWSLAPHPARRRLLLMTDTRWAANWITGEWTEPLQTKEGPTSQRCGSRRMDAPRCRRAAAESALGAPNATQNSIVRVAPIWSFPAPQYKTLTHRRSLAFRQLSLPGNLIQK